MKKRQLILRKGQGKRERFPKTERGVRVHLAKENFFTKERNGNAATCRWGAFNPGRSGSSEREGHDGEGKKKKH